MRIALGQFVGAPADKDANLRLIGKLATDAAERKAGVLVLPELFLTGYNIGEAIAALAEPSDGPSAMAVGRIAAALGLAIIYGYPERTPEGVYNAAAVIDRNGRRVANYRKVHLWGDDERAQFLAASRSALFELDGLKLGLQICYDLDFPELARAQAQSGADGLIVLSATTAPYPVVPRHLVPARAYENQMFVAFANRTGEEHGLRYAGESCIAAPDGAVLTGAGTGEALVCADVEPAAYAAYVRAHRFIPQPPDETREPAGRAAQ